MTLSRKLATLILEKNISVSDITEMLTKYKLTSLLPTILREVKQMNKGESKKDMILIESPFELGEKAIAHIKKIIGGEAPHEVTINKNLLAGWKARSNGMLYDGSAERIIKQLVVNS
jgi:F0F1-type ATP synthase delta subunit